ncbi:hypothetical protein BgiMline_010444 [Biomphalaria glabrata]|nr:hypothetical protein BgiMline_024173 [Biomphalaria glabrata]
MIATIRVRKAINSTNDLRRRLQFICAIQNAHVVTSQVCSNIGERTLILDTPPSLRVAPGDPHPGYASEPLF